MGLIQQRKAISARRKPAGTAIGLKKDSSAAHATLGSLLAEIGNKKQALKHLSTALKLKPSAPVHFLLGSVYYDAGRTQTRDPASETGHTNGSAI